MTTPKSFLVNKNPQLIQQLAGVVKKEFLGEATGHDWWHIERVWRMARYIAHREVATDNPIDIFVVEAAALLHDIADWKFHGGDETIGSKKATAILKKFNVPKQYISAIIQIINNISFKGSGVASRMKTIEGKIVQDADRLDAIGAIGISRVFAYGGKIGIPIYNPKLKSHYHKTFTNYKNKKSTSINHFSEKLLLIKNRLNTKTAKKIARSRHKYLQNFLKRFFLEWEGIN